MINIDYYIEESKNKNNISDGGSEAYSFGDVVLVKYWNSVKYGEPRQGEEQIAISANELNDRGIRTPKHLAVKRSTDGINNYCWVLQECAKGNNYTYYSSYNESDEIALERLKTILSAPSSHFEKLVYDIGQLFNMGLELKPKNFFYDEDPLNGGYTIIDLLRSDKTPYNPNSIVDIYELRCMLNCVSGSLGVSFYSKTATQEQKEISNLMISKLRQRVFQAMEKVIPNFEQHRRWILRTFPVSLLTVFASNGLEVGDLSLTDEEIEIFNKRVSEIIATCLKDICEGRYQYWQIGANEIRIALELNTLKAAWFYHRDNQMKEEDFESHYEYESECSRELERIVKEEFDRQLELLAVNSDNPNVLKAKEDMDAKKRRIY